MNKAQRVATDLDELIDLHAWAYSVRDDAAALLRQQDEALRMALEFFYRVRHWEEGKPDLHDVKTKIKEVLHD